MKFSSLSIRLKLVVVSGILFAAVIGIIAVLVSNLNYRVSSEETWERAETLLGQHGARLSGSVGKSVETALSTAAAVEGLLGDPNLTRDQLNLMMTRLVETQPDILGMTLAFEPNALDGRDAEFANQELYAPEGRYATYFFHQANGGVGLETLIMTPEAGTETWYDTPVRENRTLITEPFVYPIEGVDVLMTTVSAVVRANGRAIGIVTVDLSLADIAEFTNSLLPFGNGSMMIVGTGQIWISHPVPELIGAPADTDRKSVV